MGFYLEKYRRGQCEQVWQSLQELGDLVRKEPYYADALDVARETMRRVRSNCEQLITRLEGIGYQFGYAWADPQLANKITNEPPRLGNPQPDIVTRLDQLEQAGAVLPLALRAFYEIIGAVNFVGVKTIAMDRFEYGDDVTSNEEEPLSERVDEDINPLYVLELVPGLTPTSFRTWKMNKTAPYTLAITHNAESKYFLPGGGSSLIQIPNLHMDVSMIIGGSFGTTFVEYLRHAIQSGGLPARGKAPVLEEHTIEHLTRDLLPF